MAKVIPRLTFIRTISFLVGMAIFPSLAQVPNNPSPEHPAKNIDFGSALEQGQRALKSNLIEADSLAGLIQQLLPHASKTDQFQALIFLAELAYLQQDFSSFVKITSNFNELIKDVDDRLLKFQMEFHALRAARIQNKNKQALALSPEIKKQAKTLRSFQSMSLIYDEIALVYSNLNQKDSALINSDLAIQYARRSGKRQRLYESFHTQSIVYARFGKFELAVSKALVALNLAERSNDLAGIIQTSMTLGQYQLDIENIRQALTYFEDALRSAQDFGAPVMVSKALSLLGESHRLAGNPGQSMKLQDSAVLLLNSNRSNDVYKLALYHKGLAFSDIDAHDQATLVYEQALNGSSFANFEDLSSEILLAQAKSYQAVNNLGRALESCDKSKRLLLKNQHNHLLPKVFLIESKIYEQLGKKHLALDALRRYVSTQQEFQTKKNAESIAELSELYLTEQRDRLISAQADSIEQQQEQNELNQTRLEIASLRNNLQAYVIVAFCIFILLGISIGYAVYRRRIVEQRNREAEMSQTLLRTQMNPHFIFNAMSVIQSYIYDNDVKNSTKFLVNFSRLMRLILENSPKEFIPIETEIDILNKYLETQKLRFEERFTYSLDCPEELLKNRVMIPPMITQPFIENAIEHGQLHTVEEGHIELMFRKNGNQLEIIIQDNGVGRIKSGENNKGRKHKSMATQITKDRIANLNQKYRTHGSLKLADADPINQRGTKVTITLPFKTEDL